MDSSKIYVIRSDTFKDELTQIFVFTPKMQLLIYLEF